MSNNVSVDPPGGVNLTITIIALIGTALSIVGFIAHYIPHHQYADFCDIMNDINSRFPDNDWQWPSNTRSRLWQQYRSVSANVELFHYLVTTPWYLSAFHISTAWRLRNLRGRASSLKIELIALSHIQRREELRKIMETSLSPTSTICPTDMQSSDTSATKNAQTQNAGSDAPSAAPSRWWWWRKTPPATARGAVNCERLPV